MTITVRRWSFLLVLVVVDVLGLPAGKESTTKDDDDDDHGKTLEFPARPRGRRRTRSAGGESNLRRRTSHKPRRVAWYHETTASPQNNQMIAAIAR
jgi:hypothetical protein